MTINGETVFEGEANVKSQHNWMLREANLSTGGHTVVALERETGAQDTQSFDLPTGGERWIVVNYWNPMSQGSGEGGDGPGFTFHVSDKQVRFD